ncbi:MAG: hypothetical protein IJR99_10630 [Kiritimatiellae bacterium]|nr:hypothetical protein [Kiritimatiellia bacterium]
MAALQDWSGLWRFTYGHDSIQIADPSKSAHVGSFNGANDPMSIAADKAMFALFLRGDLRPLKGKAAIRLVSPARSPLPFVAYKKLSWDWLSWYLRTGTYIGEKTPENVLPLGDDTSVLQSSSEALRKRLFPDWTTEDRIPLAGDGAVRIDPTRGAIALSTPCCAGGFTAHGDIRTDSLRAKISGGPAGVWALSLDGQPLAKSSRLLVVHATDAQNTDARFTNESMRVLSNWGHLPMLM